MFANKRNGGEAFTAFLLVFAIFSFLCMFIGLSQIGRHKTCFESSVRDFSIKPELLSNTTVNLVKVSKASMSSIFEVGRIHFDPSRSCKDSCMQLRLDSPSGNALWSESPVAFSTGIETGMYQSKELKANYLRTQVFTRVDFLINYPCWNLAKLACAPVESSNSSVQICTLEEVFREQVLFQIRGSYYLYLEPDEKHVIFHWCD